MKRNYSSPSIEVVEIEIEKGFATSASSVNNYAAEGYAGMLMEGNTYNM